LNAPDRDVLDRAARALEGGRLEQAHALCEQALSRSRRDPRALYLMGCTLYALHERDEAIAYLERCARVDPKNATVHLRLGEVLTADGQYTAALGRFEKAQKLDPASAPALAGKAEVFDRRGQHEKVGRLLAPLVKSDRVDATTARLLARCLWKTGRDDEAIDFVRKRIDDPSTTRTGRRELNFLLGKIHEKRSEYDEAFAAYAAANETADEAYDAAAFRRRIDELIDVYSRENLRRYARSTLALEDPVFIVGMPRTGSTLVERIIDAHPAARGLGEIAAMNRITRSLPLTIGTPLPYPPCVRDLTAPIADQIGTGYVEAVRKKARPAQRAVDKYLPNFENLGLLSLILPAAHIIECQRDPMDACLSCFAEPLHPAGHPWASRLEDLGAHYRQYERIMDHWKSVLDLPILEVNYEELPADQETSSRERPVPALLRAEAPDHDAQPRAGGSAGLSRFGEPFQPLRAPSRAAAPGPGRPRLRRAGVFRRSAPGVSRRPGNPRRTSSSLPHACGVYDQPPDPPQRPFPLFPRPARRSVTRSSDEQVLRQAAEALEAGNLQHARALCEQSLARRRRNPAALYLMGCTLYALNRHDEAIRHLQQSAKLAPKNIEAFLRLGDAYLAVGNHRGALSAYEKAQKLDPASTVAVYGKAEVFDREGRHERVAKVLEPFVASGREDAAMARLVARHLWKAGRDEEAIRFLHKHLDDPSTPARRRRELYFLLGKIHEKRSEYDRAFDAYQKANEAFGEPYDPAAFRRRVDELIETYSRENLSRFARATLKAEDPVFIVGMPRTGSTLVERIIDAHPWACGIGEFFEMSHIVRGLSLTIGSTQPYPRCVREITPAVADQVATAYLEAARERAGGAERFVDKYLSNFENLGLLALILPRGRIIECQRNPMDACFSCFGEPLHPAGNRYASDLRHAGMHYRQYDRLMEHWKSVLDLPILEVNYEELTADQETISRRIIDFIGLPWNDQCLRYYELKRQIMTLSREQVDKPVYRHAVNRAERFARHLGPLKAALAGED
jgi:tetratricopeptide (TPR) repeat protein